ncbi:hypothetical [Yersinia pestis KIM10+]|uniref:Uncharacterized protein n=1 Tax=Yersinia pestis TaxID=632 RepID=Q8CL05_YERPE|nr:hypothetical [Yersinia pestis KIM10+]
MCHVSQIVGLCGGRYHWRGIYGPAAFNKIFSQGDKRNHSLIRGFGTLTKRTQAMLTQEHTLRIRVRPEGTFDRE